MGQRANYVIIENGRQIIHYNHWRASTVLSDLYLGEKRFLTFMRECEIRDELLDESSLEALVIVDIEKKQLFFDAAHAPRSSVMNFYVKELRKKWQGWQVQRMPNWAYDIELILGIDYASGQGFFNVFPITLEEFRLDKVENVVTTLVVIKDGNNLYPVGTGEDVFPAGIIALGEVVIDIFLCKAQMALLPENYKDRVDCVVIDKHEKHIFMSTSWCGLWESARDRWPGYQFTMGNYDYIDTLELAGIKADHLKMPMTEIEDHFQHVTKAEDDFDPRDFANAIQRRHLDVQFNPSFFDSVKPKPTFFERMKSRLKKVLGG